MTVEDVPLPPEEPPYPDWEGGEDETGEPLEPPAGSPANSEHRKEHAHTLCFMLKDSLSYTVRADSAEDLKQHLAAIQTNGILLDVGETLLALKAQGAIVAGGLAATPVGYAPAPPPPPAQPDIRQQYPDPVPVPPPAPQGPPPPWAAAPSAPPPPPPAAPQGGGGGRQYQFSCPPGWYRFKSPFAGNDKQEWERLKGELEKIGEQQGNKRKFLKYHDKHWYVDPMYMGWFQKWNPVVAG